jgi:hypothetical protein
MRESPILTATGALPRLVSGRLLPETAPRCNAPPTLSDQFETKVGSQNPARVNAQRFPSGVQVDLPMRSD